MTTLSALIVSDIHADEKDTKWTRVNTEPPVPLRNRQPLSDLFHWAVENSFKADYLLAPGDIANQADAVGLAYAWRKLHEIADLIGARLLAAPGNHDIVTHSAAADPRAFARVLLPSFPSGDATLDAHFWEHGWTIHETDEHRFLILDSMTDFPPFPPGVTPYDGSEAWNDYKQFIDRGGFPESMETQLDAVLLTADHRLNIALLHHHPQEHQLSSYMQDGYGPMRRGSDLIDLLSRHPKTGRWIVVHGHKHIPQLAHAIAATSNGPLILCAASVGAKLWDPIDTVTRNQFHVLEATDETLPGAASLRGSVRSYTWGYGNGWLESERRGSGLPGVGGFGCADDFRSLADRICDVMDAGGLSVLSLSSLTALIPQFPFQLPKDFAYLEDLLEERGFIFTRDRLDQLLEVVRKDVA